MPTAEVVSVSSKGQIVIPASMRRDLGIEAGDRLFAWSDGNSLLLKRVRVPGQEEFDAWLEDAQVWARESGLTEEDIPGIIAEVRAKIRAEKAEAAA